MMMTDGPRVPLGVGGTDVEIADATRIFEQVRRQAPGAWANAMLAVFAPGYKATKQSRKPGSDDETPDSADGESG